MKGKDLSGKKFHKLSVIERSGSNRQGSSTWKCLCDCGKYITASSDYLTRKTQPISLVVVKGLKEGTVINLEDYRPVWTNSKMCCSNCQSVWVATFHIDTEKLECYNCGELVPVTKEEK